MWNSHCRAGQRARAHGERLFCVVCFALGGRRTAPTRCPQNQNQTTFGCRPRLSYYFMHQIMVIIPAARRRPSSKIVLHSGNWAMRILICACGFKALSLMSSSCSVLASAFLPSNTTRDCSCPPSLLTFIALPPFYHYKEIALPPFYHYKEIALPPF